MKGRDWFKAVRYSEVFKKKMLQKMMGQNSRSASALAKEAGVHQSTFSRWLREAGNVSDMGKKKTKKWSKVEKLRVVIEAGSLSDEELGAFLRREGIYGAQLDEWKKIVLEAFDGAGLNRRKANEEARKVKALERDLRRKNRALAEVSALLILKKKADAIWGVVDDDTNGKIGR